MILKLRIPGCGLFLWVSLPGDCALSCLLTQESGLHSRTPQNRQRLHMRSGSLMPFLQRKSPAG